MDNDSAIKDAKLKRRTAKAALTRAGNNVTFLITAKRPIEEVKEALAKLEENFKRLETRQEELENLLDDEEFEKEEVVMEECQSRYLQLSVQAKDFIIGSGAKEEVKWQTRPMETKP